MPGTTLAYLYHQVSAPAFVQRLVFHFEKIKEITKSLKLMRSLGKGEEVVEDDHIVFLQNRLQIDQRNKRRIIKIDIDVNDLLIRFRYLFHISGQRILDKPYLEFASWVVDRRQFPLRRIASLFFAPPVFRQTAKSIETG